MFSLKNIFGDANARAVSKYYPIVEKINALEKDFQALSDTALKDKTREFKERLAKGETLNDILPEAFSAVREASVRTLGQRHFDVQLIGGMILNDGGIAEMRTGEGKTLVATLPAYLNALSGKGVHLVTVNDYLSRRDAVWMGQIYNFLGLSVGIINHEQSFLYDATPKNLDEKRDEVGSFKVVHEFLRECSRREAYGADITYGTNNEYGFDYLRDNIEQGEQFLRQRDYNFAIVDEIDSILIDEARTPLIISSATNESESLYGTFASIAGKLSEGGDFTVDEKLKAITLTDEGITKAEKLLGVENIYTEKGIKYVHHLETAVRAKALFHLNKEYVVKNDEVIIVDEFTGRLQPGRRWSEGLHQAIEAKEGVKVQKESRTFASITFQNYFRLYKKLSGMTGTAMTSSEEFFKVYNLNVVSVPTNKPNERVDLGDQIFQTEKGKFKAIARKIKELNGKGQPVLVGTVSIETNELLSEYLKREGVQHEILNAKPQYAEREGEIVAQAGRKGAVTISTNMAGRGVDIKLGGNPAVAENYEEVKKLGGLFVLGTERHEARRIDNQLRGRSGRQGDPGATQFFVSMEDSLMRVFASDMIKKMMGRFGIPEDQPIENGLITRSLETAQKKIEGFNFDARKHILEFDDVMSHQRKIVYERRRAILVGDKKEVDDYLENILQNSPDSEKERALLEAKKKAIPEEDFYRISRSIILQTIDLFWMDHLEMMDYLRGSVNLRAYGQRNPLVEYKKEGLKFFREMQESIEAEVLKLILGLGEKIDAPVGVSAPAENFAVKQANLILSGGNEPASDEKIGNSSPVKSKPSEYANVGRNDICPCGATRPDGKPIKFKNCHGKNL